MGYLRLFIALDIPLSLQEAIQHKVNSLRKQTVGPGIRWVEVKNIHITLKFLGDTPPPKVDDLKQMLRAEARVSQGFDIALTGLDCFPNSKRPRVLFIGIQAPEELEALQSRIESAAVKLGFRSDERQFSPHLTIGRVKDGATQEELQTIRKLLEDETIDSPCPARVDSVHLYQSDLRPGGSVYTKLYSAPLKPAQ